MTDHEKIKETQTMWALYVAHVKETVTHGNIGWLDNQEMIRNYTSFAWAYGMAKGWIEL